MKQIVVIDGQGGGFGRALIEGLRAAGVREEIIAVGLNSVATTAMLRGLVMANSMLGECSPAVAMAVAESRAQRVLIAATKCGTHIAGLPDMPLAAAIADGVRVIRGLLAAQ